MLNKYIFHKQPSEFIGSVEHYADAKTVLFGAPFDSTTSNRPGARFGPAAIRAESYGLETYSPYQNRDLTDCGLFDSGDLELPFGAPEHALGMIKQYTAQILTDNKRPFLLGGEHLVTLGAVEATLEKYPDLHIIHFDAHADLREDYLGNPLSHATVVRRCFDRLGKGRIFQFGIRSGDRKEFAFADEGGVSMTRFGFDGLAETLVKLGDVPIYLTIDLDVLDPSVFPGTGTPEPGGVIFMELLNATISVCQNGNVVACDLVELAPHYDGSGVSTAVGCKMVREMVIGVG